MSAGGPDSDSALGHPDNRPSARSVIGSAIVPLVRGYVRYSPLPWGKRFLYDQFGWRQRAFHARTRFGARFSGTTIDLIQRSVYWFGTWEPNLTAWVHQRLADGDTFLDVGANAGYYTLLASRLVGPTGRVVSIEPSPSIFGLLRGAVSANHATNVVTLNAAAGAAKGAAPIFRGPDDQLGWSSMLPHWEAGLTSEGIVNVVPLDDVVPPAERGRVRIVKIDVEGFETDVIAGARGLIAGAERAEFVVEVNATSFPTVCAEFARAGFHPYVLLNSYNPVDYISPTLTPATRADDRLIPGRGDVVFSKRDVAEL